MPEKITFAGRVIQKLNNTFRPAQANVQKNMSNGNLAFRNIPLPFNSYVQMVGSNEKTPLYRWSYSWVMDLFYGSDLLRLIVKSINDEI